MKRSNGIILFEGPSRLDGAPIVAIMTGTDRPSANRKTGPMIQTWILRADEEPTDAIRSGADASICGSCPLRGVLGAERACYVNVGQAPLAVYRAWRRGVYLSRDMEHAEALVAGRALRIGSYGDPAAAPLSMWARLASAARTWTGYTHQWADLRPARRRMAQRLLMASTSSPAETAAARAAGWRTFEASAEASADAVECPADRGLTSCDRCSLCRGTSSGARSVWIRPHGPGARYA